MGILHPQECYFIEQTVSLASYETRYREFKTAMDIAETRYQEVMRHIPIDFRNRAINQQLDITWGSCVLPNLRRTLKVLEQDYILRLRNDLGAFPSGGLISSDAKGMYADMGVDLSWMGSEAEQQFQDHFWKAKRIDDNIAISTNNRWVEGYLTWGFILDDPDSKFGLTLPQQIPRYELVSSEVIKTGEKPRAPGLYLPHVEHGAAAFLYPNMADYVMPALQGQTFDRYVSKYSGEVFYYWEKKNRIPTAWTLIRRVEGEYLDVPPEGFFPNHHPLELYNWPERESQYRSQLDATRITAWSGEPCPHSGRWSTLMYRGVEFAHVEQGQSMPDWLDEHGAPQKAKWTPLNRDDGGDPLVTL